MIDMPDLGEVALEARDQREGPWAVRASFYEERKLATVLACLNQPRYRHAWDAACGMGELAARLAPRTERLLATDSTTQAAQLTAVRCQEAAHVRVREWELPATPRELPERFDLVVLSEIAYHLSDPQRAALVAMLDAVTAPDAEIVAVHWRYRPHDGWLSGEDVQSELVDRLTALGWRHRVQHDDEDFVLDDLVRER
jgi:SAM-dependent methyltransferase